MSKPGIIIISEPDYHEKVSPAKKRDLEEGEVSAMSIGCLCVIKWFGDLKCLIENIKVTFYQTERGQRLIPMVVVNLKSDGETRVKIDLRDYKSSMSFHEIARSIIVRVQKTLKKNLSGLDLYDRIPKVPRKEIVGASDQTVGA